MIPNGIGAPNPAGINYYKRLIAALKAANIEPMVRHSLPWSTRPIGYDMRINRIEIYSICSCETGNFVSLGSSASVGEHGRMAESVHL